MAADIIFFQIAFYMHYFKIFTENKSHSSKNVVLNILRRYLKGGALVKFTSDFIRELKDRCRIEDVVGKKLSLKRAGSNYVACCPFHSEKTPSFTVFPASGSYYCFGCSEGGDIITFVMKTENIEYAEAVKKLAAECSLPIPAEDDPRVLARQRAKKRLMELNLFAAKFYRERLFAPEGAQALDYLLNKRRLSLATIKHFGLGFAPSDWNVTCSAMLAAGFTEDEILEGFFAGRSQKTGKLFDYFRNRVMFPYFDVSGKVIAFGGRILGDGEPKYLNTKDTSVFKKGLNLYALNYAKNEPEGALLLCEGYMDVISLHQAGFTGAVASCGTALTAEQGQLISRYGKRIVICYDSDRAGTLATARAAQILNSHDITVAVLNHAGMKGEKDPDDFIKKHGSGAFSDLINGSGSHSEYRLSQIFAKYNLADPEDKIRLVRESARFIATLDGKIAREVYSAKVAEKAGLSEKAVLSEVEHAVKRLGTENRKRYENDRIKDISRISDRVNPQAALNLKAVTAEDNLIGLLCAFPEMISKAQGLISSDEFVTDLNKDIYSHLLELSASGEADVSLLSEFFDTSVMSRLYELMHSRKKLSVNDIGEIKNFVSTIKQEKQKNKSVAEMSNEEFLAAIAKRNDT